jgi:hypothetical protein
LIGVNDGPWALGAHDILDPDGNGGSDNLLHRKWVDNL